jgi:glycosyltransferase involved in cell wall biosynthesis
MTSRQMSQSDIAVIVTSFERPASLARALLSLSLQAPGDTLAEIVVADDGSRDNTWQVVDRFARESGLMVTLTTHEHAGFQLCRSRNEGALASSAPYLAFIDGDCVMPPNFLATHVARRRRGVGLCGESYRIQRVESERVTDETIRRRELLPLVRAEEHERLARKARRDRWYSFFRVPMRPRLTGNHFSLWRSDFERIDGFDQGFRGWGLEDCDLQRRLGRVGIRCRSVLPEVVGFHLWHPTDPTFVRKARGTPNEAYYREPFRRDGRARSGLSAVDRGAMTVWRWQGGKLIELPRRGEVA